MRRMARAACGVGPDGVRARSRAWCEPLEGRVLLSAVLATDDSAADAPGDAAPAGVVVIQSETYTAELPINALVAAKKATVTATPFDIGSIENIFDGDNSSIYRSANINPAVIEVAFVNPKTVREFTLRFSHAPTYRWKVEAVTTPGGAYTEIVPFTNASGDVDSTRRLAAPLEVYKLRLTAQRTSGDNYVHLDEWHIVGDVTITSLALSPANAVIRQFGQQRFVANAKDADGISTDFSRRVTWSSSNEAVVKVDADGLAHAVAPGTANVIATLGTLSAQAAVTVSPPPQRDLDVTYIERTPRYNYDAAKNNPAPGDIVTFRGHIKNWDNVSPPVDYRWELDGQIVAGGSTGLLQPNEEVVPTWQWAWQPGPHRVKLVVDPDAKVSESSEVNNAVEDRTDGLAVGFWVEQSLYNYFHDKQRNLNIGSNSWEDWAQRQMTKWNEHNANAVWAGITPNGVTDRVRVDKITVVPDGALPLNGGLPSNNPDSRDKTPDLVWGFEWNPSSTFYSNTTSKDPGNPFYLEPSLRHEMGHARYEIDEYTWDVANNNQVTQVQIIEPTTGQPVAGTPLMPFIAFNSVLYYNQSGGMMTGPWGNNIWSPHEAGSLQRIAGRRAVAGNMNAPGNIGEYLNDLPTNNHFRFVNGAGQPLAGANVTWYAASPGPGYGGKTFDNTPEYTLTADADGSVVLPRDPFLPGNHKEAVIRVEKDGQIWYRFFEVGEMNLEYWRGHRQDGFYTVELPLRTAPPEMELLGLGTVPIADGDLAPSPDDGTDFGNADVYATGPGLGLDDPRGYVIRTFAVKNRGGQPLRLTGTPKVSIFGANPSDFSVVYQPADTITSQTITVFQIKFDPRAAGVRTANVTVSNNDGDELRYDFAIRGTGALVGAEVPGVKFNDLDADGVRGASEPGLAGWTIYADLDGNGAFGANEPSVVSGADGTFTLGGLPTDRITNVREVLQGGWRQTAPAEGFYVFNPFIDALQQPFVFGNTQKTILTGTVFDDRNRNGVMDPGEAGVAGNRLYVDLDNDSEQDPAEPTTVSDASGHYAFEGLDPGTYTVAMLYAGGWSMTPGDGHTRQITLLPGQVLTRDWGVERYVSSVAMVYNNSAFDGNDPAANAADDNATEPYRGPLFPGQQGSPSNVSNYTRGINAIALDIGALPVLPGGAPLSAADFVFRVGNVSDTASWQPAPAPTEVAVRRGADPRGTDRVTVIFPDNSIRNTWLEVTVLATPRTGIVEPLVVYFGNHDGDGANDGGDLRVNALDLAAVRRAINTAATVESRVDFNKDGRVNSLDLAAVRSNLTRTIAAIQPPAPPPPPPAAARRADDDTRATSLLTAPN